MMEIPKQTARDSKLRIKELPQWFRDKLIQHANEEEDEEQKEMFLEWIAEDEMKERALKLMEEMAWEFLEYEGHYGYIMDNINY
jgi:hypothetical protein